MKKILILLVATVFYGKMVYAQTSGRMFTIAGGGSSLSNGVTATAARLLSPSGVCVDNYGNIYISENGACQVRKIDAATNRITTIAGMSGLCGFSGDGGPATLAKMNAVYGIRLDTAGNILMADYANGRIRKLNVATGIITTIAGGGSSIVDGVTATNAALSPRCVLIDNLGNIYTGDNLGAVKKIDATSGLISTVASIGGGTVKGLEMDAMGNLYILNNAGNNIKKVDASTGMVSLVAGGGLSLTEGAPATSAQLTGVTNFGTDAGGNLFIADFSRSLIRWVDAATGLIKTIAGGGTNNSDGAPATSADIAPTSIMVDQNAGILYFTNSSNSVRRFTYEPITPFPLTSLSTLISDSFGISIRELCSGPQLRIRVPLYHSGMKVVTYFGDGTASTNNIFRDFIGYGGYTIVGHMYDYSGLYSLKQVLYIGSAAVDSLRFEYNYTRCTTIPIQFNVDHDCVRDSLEYRFIEVVKTEVDSNGIPIDTICATSGFYYNAQGAPGDIYSFKPVQMPVFYNLACPISGIIYDTIKSGSYSKPTKEFMLYVDSTSYYDLAINCITAGSGNNTQDVYIYYQNYFNTPTDAQVTVTFSPKYRFNYSYPPPNIATGNTLQWNLVGLTGRSFYVPYIRYRVVNSGPLIPLGDTVQTHISITPISGDVDSSNNFYTRIDTVRGSYDPNMIQVTPEGCIASGVNPNELQYAIHFENTGNDTAHNIYLMDTLSDNLDLSTMEIITATAAMMVTKIQYGAGHSILKFDFPHINLPDTSHHGLADGAVFYKIKTKAGLSLGDVVANRAGIYFDYNDVVMTNTAINVIGCPNTINVANTTETPPASIYPNPGTNSITIATTPAAYSAYTLHNAMGQEIIANTINTPTTNIDVKGLPAGVYTITIKGAAGAKVEKWVKW